jgi:hypothetical protein
MRKALTPPAIHFKGSGWAKKDAQSTARTKPASDAPAEAKSGSAGVGDQRSGEAPDKGAAGEASKRSVPGDGSKTASTTPTAPTSSAVG